MKPRLLAFVLAVVALLTAAGAEDFSTINGDKMPRFFATFAERQGPVRVLCFGDSMSDAYQSISLYLVNQMMTRRPFAGTSFNNSFNRTLWRSTNGATVVPPENRWISYQFRVPEGANLWWDNQLNANGVLSDQLGLYWVAQPEGGPFKLFSSERGREWVQIAELDGYSPTLVGRSTNINVPLSEYRLKVESVSGTNYIIGPQQVNRQTNGLHIAWLSYQGLTLPEVMAVPLSVREPILRDFAPDLLIWHFKESYVFFPFYEAGLEETHNWLRNADPEMDVLYIGTPRFANDDGGTMTYDENRIIRAFAIAKGRPYMDCMTPTLDLEWMREQKYFADTWHLSYPGSTYVSQGGWKDLGLFTLGARRNIALRQTGGTMLLEAALVPWVTYEFQSSTNLADWTTFETQSGLSGAVSIEIPADRAESNFRLKMMPLD